MIFTELLTLKMKGRNLAIDQMTRFIQLKSMICKYSYRHCQDWIGPYFNITCYNFYYSDIDYIDKKILRNLVSKIEKDTKKSRFTFLCCIKGYYKDIDGMITISIKFANL